MISSIALVCGAAGGAAVVLGLRELLPARPDLADALRRLDPDQAPTVRQAPPAAGVRGWPDVLGNRMISTLGDTVRLPRKDLALLRIDPARYLGVKTLWAAGGLVFPQLLAALLSWAGVSLPFVLPGGLSLGMAALLWVHETQQVKQRAKELRLEYRWAIASYLERVELARAAGIGASKALYEAAAVGDSWTFVRLRAALEEAQLSGVSSWDALKQLAEELDVPELARPAETLALAGEDGASVRDALTAQARQLRIALLSDAKAEANTASEQMIVPVVGLVFLMVIFVMYAAVSQVFSS
jgi:Flp pilus assembly protein TadB